LGESGPPVARRFTNREEFIEVFQRAVSRLPPKEYEILVYYGVGGIGKTSLRIELGRLLEDRHPQAIWTVLDFLTPAHREPETALFWLRQELNHKYAVQFPSFDLAYVIFWQKSRPQTPLRKDPTRLEALLEKGTLFANLMSLVGEVPILSLVPKLSTLISKTDRLFREWWTKRGHRDLNRLQEMSATEIAEWLPAFWAADLKDYFERDGRPAVLFMDTYEALWDGADRRTEGRFFTQDEWVRELIAHLPEVLWVVTGRERLRWEELDKDWRNYQHQYLVGGLAEADARTFLASCGISEEALQEAIIGGSEGVPVYLDLAVDTYLQIEATQQRDPTLSDFQGTPQDVLHRFLRYLDRSETETLKVMSVARFWDRTLFESLIEKFNTGYPSTALQELRRFSFVQEEQVPGIWTIHPLMRVALEEHLDTDLRGRVHRYLFDYYNNSLEDLESTAIADKHKIAFTEAFHHGRCVLATDELFDWFLTAEVNFYRAALWRFLLPLYEDFARLIEDRLGPEHPNTVTALNNLGDAYREQGRYREAETPLKRALEISEEVLGPEHPLTAIRLSNVASLYRAQGRDQEAETLFVRALKIWNSVPESEPEAIAASFNNLAELYREQGRLKEAEPLQKRALGISHEILGSEHPLTATNLNNLASLYRVQGRYEEAEPLRKRVLEIREKVLGPEHPETAQSLNNLAVLYFHQDRNEEAEPLYLRALEIREKVLGPEHPDTARSLNNLAELYRDQGRDEEAETHYRRAIEILEKVFDPAYPSTARTRNRLAELYIEQGRNEEAEMLFRRTFASRFLS